MAARVLAFYTLCILLCSLHGVVTAARSTPKKSLHLTYFAHEVHFGPNLTLLSAAGPGAGNLTTAGWGTLLVFDNSMRDGNSSDSLHLGSITGSTVVTSKGGDSTTGRGSQIHAQHLFEEGSKYNGSSLTVIGHFLTPTPVATYEIMVVGGTGSFRGYSGYGILSPVPNAPVDALSNVFKWDIHISSEKRY